MTADEIERSLRGVRILIVEDDFIVARALKHHLTAIPCEIVGPVPTVEKARALTDGQPFDIAILDIQLRGNTVAPFAELLHRRNRPFLFLTGYGDLGMLPEHLRGYPHLEKPVDPDVLVETIAKLLGARRRSQGPD